jgi:hypothetical protein
VIPVGPFAARSRIPRVALPIDRRTLDPVESGDRSEQSEMIEAFQHPEALVVSLEFELHWAMRDHVNRDGPAYAELSASRSVVEEIARPFGQRSPRATSATVGFLFASSRRELVPHLPKIRDPPKIRASSQRAELDPYLKPIGRVKTSSGTPRSQTCWAWTWSVSEGRIRP